MIRFCCNSYYTVDCCKVLYTDVRRRTRFVFFIEKCIKNIYKPGGGWLYITLRLDGLGAVQVSDLTDPDLCIYATAAGSHKVHMIWYMDSMRALKLKLVITRGSCCDEGFFFFFFFFYRLAIGQRCLFRFCDTDFRTCNHS